MTRISASAEVRATCAYSRCSASRSVSSSNSDMQMTASSGVRISWLMRATSSMFMCDGGWAPESLHASDFIAICMIGSTSE